MIRLEIVNSLSRLNDLTAEWSVLARSIESITPFQLPEWLMPWWAHFGSGELRIMVLRADRALVGLVPCFLHEWNGKRQMTLIGAGISDYLEPPIHPKCAAEIMNVLQLQLAADRDWDVCDWQDLSADTPLRTMQFNGGMDLQVNEDVPCSEVQFVGTFEEFWSRRSKDMRRNLRRYTQRARPAGDLEFEHTGEANVALLDTLIELHAARWRKRGEPGMVQANRSAEFLRVVAAEFAKNDMLRIFSLRYQGKIAAAVLTFLYANRIFSYISALDPQFESLGFGRNLLYEAIRLCYEEGREAWNFLRGDEPYKFSWGAQRIAKSRLVLARKARASHYVV